MMQRIKQFIGGCTAKGPDQAEQQLIAAHLQARPQQLFYEMNKADQRHCLNVLATAQGFYQEALSRGQAGQGLSATALAQQQALLVRCCLLHDIGRGCEMGPIRKSWGVILHKLWPKWSRAYSLSPQPGYFRDILFRYYHHPAIGAEILSSLGMQPEAEIIALHHSSQAGDIPSKNRIILTILKKSDELN